MSLYVFDTDALSLYQHGHPVVIQNAAAHLSAGLAITVITIEEQLSGWYTLLRRAKTHAQSVRGRQQLHRVLIAFFNFRNVGEVFK